MAKRRTKRRSKRNRKKSEARVSVPSPLVGILVTVAMLSLAYLWLCGRCDALGKEITRLEKKVAERHGRRLNEEYKWSNMKSPGNMERLLKKHNLVMTLPNEADVIRVRASAWDIDPALENAGYAQGTKAVRHD